MLCGNCKEGYDPERHVPRILISCGHTFCQICIEEVLEREKHRNPQNTGTVTIIDCFECGLPCQVNNEMGINALPKNQVLIQLDAMS